MSKSKSDTVEKKTPSPREIEIQIPSRGHEVIGVALVLGALFVLLSLITYDGVDVDRVPIPGGNLLGPAGMWVAHFMLSLFGIASYLIDFCLWVTAALLFTSKIRAIGAKNALAFIVLSVLSSVLAYVALRGEEFYGGLSAGGFIGAVIGEISISLVSVVGTVLICVGAILLIALLTTDLSLVAAVRLAWMAIAASGRWAFRAIGELIDAWKQSSAKLRDAEEEEDAPAEEAPSSALAIVSPREVKAVPVDEAVSELESEDAPQAELKIISKRASRRKKKGKPSPSLHIEQGVSGDFQLPPLSLLVEPSTLKSDSASEVDEVYLKQTADCLKAVLADFSVYGDVREVHPGPVVTMFEFQPKSGTKLSKIGSLSNEIAMALEVKSVRVVAPIPGKNAVGFEFPNRNREMVSLRELLEDDSFSGSKGKLPLSLGKDINGTPYTVDLAKMPHLLIAGTTGSGKSVSVNTMLLSLLYRFTPEDLRLLLIDPKMIELGIYDGIPHLLLPVVTDMTKACLALKWAVDEMERRYQAFADLGARNLESYNRKVEKLLKEQDEQPSIAEQEAAAGEPIAAINLNGQQVLMTTGEEIKPKLEKLPTIVIFIDELADLMMVAAKDVETSIARLAQKARAAGLHLIVATQRPSTDVITGLIKANFPARISFRVSSGIDSRTILGANGAESLLGKGDMLVIPPGTSELKRVHGSFVDEEEIREIVDFLKTQGNPEYDEEILKDRESDNPDIDDDEKDEVYDQAVAIVAEAQACSISMIQRRLRIGYNRAARIVEVMEREGVVGPANGVNKREVLISQISA